MRPVCHLHIGMNKAGSTAIQLAFIDYVDPQLEYLRPAGDTVPHTILDRTFRRPRDVRLFGADGPELAEADAAFDALMTRSDRAALISYENLSIWPERDAIERIRARLLEHCAAVQVLAYIRPPRGYMRSDLQQRVKMYPPPPGLDALWPDYRRRFARWDRVFGREAVTLVPFRRDGLTGGDLLQDVCRRIGADPTRLGRRETANSAAPLEASAALAVWNRAHAAKLFGDRMTPMPDVNRFAMAIADFGQTTDWGFAGPALDSLLDAKAADIEWITDRLGCPGFTQERGPGTGIAGMDDFLDIGRRQAEALATWLPQRWPGLDLSGVRTTETLLQAAFLHMLRTRSSARWKDRFPPAWRRRARLLRDHLWH